MKKNVVKFILISLRKWHLKVNEPVGAHPRPPCQANSTRRSPSNRDPRICRAAASSINDNSSKPFDAPSGYDSCCPQPSRASPQPCSTVWPDSRVPPPSKSLSQGLGSTWICPARSKRSLTRIGPKNCRLMHRLPEKMFNTSICV